MNKQNNVWKRVAAWTLAASMVVGSNSFTVLAESMPDAEQSELEIGEFADGFLAETEGEDGTADEWQGDSFTDGEESEKVADGFTSGETEELADFAEDGEEEGEIQYDYQFPEYGMNLLVYDEANINRTINCYITKPGGETEYQPIEAESLTIVSPDNDEEFSDVCSVLDSDDNGWQIRANRIGDAVALMEYVDAEGNTQIHRIYLYVHTVRNSLVFDYPNDMPRMLMNSEMEVPVHLYHQWRNGDEENGEGDGEVESFELRFRPDENDWSYNTDLIDVEFVSDEAGKPVVKITSKGETGDTDIHVSAYVDGEEWAVESLHVWVTDGYSVITSDDMGNPLVGDTLYLKDKNLQVHTYWTQESRASQVEDPKEITYEVEYDNPDYWMIQESDDGNLPSLTRINNGQTGISIIAYKDGEEIARRYFNFDYIDYGIWFQNLRDDGWSWVFSDEENYELVLNTEGLEGKIVDISWYVSESDESGNGVEVEKGGFWDTSENGISIDGTQMADCGYDVIARALVNVEGHDPVEVSRCDAFITVQDTEENLEYDAGTSSLFRGENVWIDRTYQGFVRNAEHPWGDDVEVTIDSLDVEDVDCYDDEEGIIVAEEDEYGWNLRGEYAGEAAVQIKGHTEDGTDVKYEFHLWVLDSMRYVEIGLPNETGQMLAGETVEVPVTVYQEERDAVTGKPAKVTIDPSEYTLQWEDVDEDGNGDTWYNSDILEVEAGEEPGTIKITAKGIGETDLNIGAYGTDEDDEEWEVNEHGNIHICVEASNYILYPIRLENVNPKIDEELDLNAYDPHIVVRSYSESEEEDQENKITGSTLNGENIRFSLENYDTNAWKIKEGTEENEIPVLVRKGEWETEVTLVAEERRVNEFGHDYYEEIARQTYHFGLTEETYDYQIDDDPISMFVNENDYEILPYINCWVRNDTYPSGRDCKVEITNIEISNAEDEQSGEDICELYAPDPDDEEDDGIWRIHANRIGHAVATVFYNDYQEEEQSYTVDIYVTTDMFTLDFDYPNGMEYMLKNSEIEIPTALFHDWKYGDDDRDGEEITNYTLKLGEGYSEEFLEQPELVKDESGRKTIVKLKSRDFEDDEWGFVDLEAYMEEEDGSSTLVWSGKLWIKIVNNYTTLLPTDLEDLRMLQVGEVLDLNTLGLQLLRYENGEGKPVEDVTFDVWYEEYSNEDGYESGDWKDISEEGDELPRLIRMNSGEIEITITAYQHDEETGEEVNVGERIYYFSELDYAPEYVDDKNVVFSNETGENSYCLELNTENLEDKKNVQIEWEVGNYVENEETEEADWTPVETDDPFWEVSEDGTKFYIDGKKMYAAGEDLNYVVRTLVYVSIEGEEEPLLVNENSIGIWAREPVYDYWNLMDYPTFFYDVSFFVPNYLICYVEDAEHPWGDEVRIPVDITKVETIEADGYDGDNLPDICTLKEEPGEGWWLEGRSCGRGAVSYTYTGLDGKVQNTSEDFWVTNYIRYIKTDLEENALDLLIDEEAEITLSVIGETHDPETGKVTTEVIPASDYEFFLQDYAKNAVSAWIAEDGKLHIQAVSDESDTVVNVYARSTDPEDEWDAILPNGIYVVPAAAFYTADVEKSLENAWPELTDTFNLNEYVPYVMCRAYDEAGEIQETRMDDIQFILEYEEDKWKVLEGTEEEDIPTLIRTSTDETEITLLAGIAYVDEYGREQWEYVAQWKYLFGGLYDINGEHSWTEGVVTKEPTCEEAGSKEYLCKSCGETRTEEIPALGHAWNLTAIVTSTCVAEGYNVYTCATCKQTKREVIPKLAHTMVTVIDSVATCGTVGKQHQECSECGGARTELPDTPATGNHSWKENGVVAATCTTAGSRNYICETCGQTRSEAIPATGTHSWKENGVVAATCTTAGSRSYICETCGQTRSETIPATGTHTWGAYVVTEAATAVKEGIETRTCSVCGQTESRSVARLNAYVKVTESTFPMKRGQTFTLPVTMESGDYIESVISQNTKRITVSWETDKVTLKAKKKAKTGKVKVTIKTKGGASTTIIVKLQKGTVAAKKILGIPDTATLKVKKTLKLQPVVSPISYQTKVSYSTSNKKVATVDKKGKITAKKAGTAIIKVTCGKITKKCKVTVTKK